MAKTVFTVSRDVKSDEWNVFKRVPHLIGFTLEATYDNPKDAYRRAGLSNPYHKRGKRKDHH